jgi:hypothetical protein
MSRADLAAPQVLSASAASLALLSTATRTPNSCDSRSLTGA